MKKLSITPEIVFIICLFLIAATFRFIRWSYFTSLAGDEGVQLLTIEHLLHFGKLPILGEISALDSQNLHILHNSPLGYYVLTAIYILGLGTPEGYTLVILLLNLLQAYLLYRAAGYLFNKQAAIITLLFALFSPTMLYASVWPSQPTLAIFFEVVALFLYAKFKHSRQEKFLLGAMAVSLLTTQFYPPMFLLLPFKVIVGALEIKSLSEKKRNMAFITIVVSAAFFLLPYAIIELTHDWINTRTIQGFFSTTTATSHSGFSLRDGITTNLSQVFAFIFPDLTREYLFSIVGAIFSCIMLISFSGQPPFQKRKLALLMFSIGPAIMLSFAIRETYILFHRAYLFVILPFLFLWMGSLWAKTSKNIWLFTCLALLLMFVSIGLSQQADNTHLSNIQRAKATAAAIVENARMKGAALENIDLLAISSYDSYGWESSFYWYSLERITGEYLADIDPHTSKAVRRAETPLATLYVICHQIDEKFTVSICLKNFEEKIDQNYYEQKFVLESSISNHDSPIFVMNVVPPTTSEDEKMETAW